MLNELFDQLAEAIGAADGVAIYKVGPVARDLGLTLIDESGGSDFNLGREPIKVVAVRMACQTRSTERADGRSGFFGARV